MSKIIDEMRALLGTSPASSTDVTMDEDASKEWERLADLLTPAIEQTKKLIQLQGKAGASGATNRDMLTKLLNAAVEVRKWADGD